MKKQLKQFGAVIGVLLLCVCGYFLMTNYFSEKQKAEENADKVEAFLIDDYKKITGITYSYNDDTVILLKDGDAWVSGENTEMELDGDTIEQEMLIQLSEISAETVIENPEDIEQYGFSKDEGSNITPDTTTIVAMDSYDKSYTVYIGASNPYDSSVYYMMKEGDDNIYVINSSVPDAFSRSATDLKEEEETTVEETIEAETEESAEETTAESE